MSSDPALWAAVAEQRERALRVARTRCATRQDAEDCVQEAMVRVAGMDDVDLDRVGPLLTTVVSNLAVDTHRSRVRGFRAQGRLHALPQPQAAVDERVCDISEARWLWSRRHQLREQDRRVLELRAQGLSVSQAAAALGITPKAAEASFTRARSKLVGIWRAAGAALAVFWAGARRPGPAGALVVTAAASVVAAVALTSGGEAPSRPPAAVRGAVPGPVEAPLPPVPRPVAEAAPPSDSSPSSPAPRASRRVTAVTAASVPDRVPGGAPPSPEVSPTPRPTPETLPQTVERCVREIAGSPPPQGVPAAPQCSPR